VPHRTRATWLEAQARLILEINAIAWPDLNVRLVWNQAAADNNLGSHQFIISCALFGRDSLFCMILGTEGWAAVIGLIRRSPDLRWPKADVEGESV
jgi:hypothetical protein